MLLHPVDPPGNKTNKIDDAREGYELGSPNLRDFSRVLREITQVSDEPDEGRNITSVNSRRPVLPGIDERDKV
jgi:hypothetical protein